MSTPPQTINNSMDIDDNSSLPGSITSKTSDLSSLASTSTTSGPNPVAREQVRMQSAQMIAQLEQQVTELYNEYLISMQQDPLGERTALAQARYATATTALVNLKNDQATFDQVHASPASAQQVARATVPSGLPFLQLKGEHLWKAKEEPFDSTYDFCAAFQRVLNAHIQDLDSNWKRLLPMCLNTEQLSWFDENLAPYPLSWEQAKTRILDHFDTPYRKFLLMAQVGSMRQGPTESNREYASRFQKLRREAGLEDGTPLAVSFFVSLRNSVKSAAQVAIASRFGSSLPVSINQMIDLVNASGDSGLVNYEANEHNHKNSYKRAKRTDETENNEDNPCNYCGKPYFNGHRCDEYVKARREGKLKKRFHRTSRMARRSTPTKDKDDNEPWNAFAMQNLEATKCKQKPITKDFISTNNDSIIFPIRINEKEEMSLLDTGANFSAIDKSFCDKNNIQINYNVQNDKDKYIKLADSASYVERIGTCKINITCNNKSFNNYTFEVMNLENNDYNMSIGLDYMHKFGIGISGLPISHINTLSNSSQSEKKTLMLLNEFKNTSQLLQLIEEENLKTENCPALIEEEYQIAMKDIQLLIDVNQQIPKGRFCTIPESMVSLETPTGETAFRRPYPVPLIYHKVVDEQIQEWLDDGIIKPAHTLSEWNCPLTIVKKTNGKGEVTGHRVCHDPRHVNALLQVKDRMPLPIISELLEELKGANVYSTLDLKSAFNSLLLNPEHAHKLNFTWRNTQYTPIGTVFGVSHVSSVMMRTMSIVLGGNDFKSFTRFFVDDIVIFSTSTQEHKMHIQKVIQRLTEVNLRLQPKKCKFFQNQIDLLGFHIAPRGISLDRRKLINVVDFPQPKTFKDIQRYTGLIQYFAPLIPNLAQLMAPLNPLRNAKNVSQIWNKTHQQAFENLKKALLNDTVLSFPDLNHEFYVGTDASNVGIGVVLYQVINGETRYISMQAKSLSKSERNYSATKRELLAVIYALKKFHKYLYGKPFTLYTDHKALTYLHTQRIANAMMISWLDTILQYDFKIVHLSGIQNVLPDTLSRLFEANEPLHELEGGKGYKRQLVNRTASLFSDIDLPATESGEYMTPPTAEERNQLLEEEHLKGHFASDAIYYALKRKGIYWKDLKNDAIKLVKNCMPCQQFNIVRKGYNPLRPIISTLPGDSWGLDLAGPFKTSTQGNNYLLIMVDVATRYCVLKPIPDKSALSICKELVQLIITFGIPRIIQSDNGTEFVNEAVQLLAQHSGFEHRLISKWHPRANGVSERFVQSSVNVIKKRVSGMSSDWDIYVPSTMFHLNCKYNERTKTPPFTLMFGRTANDFKDYSQEKDEATQLEINRELLSRIKMMTECVFPSIHERVKLMTNKQKERFDSTHKIMKIPVGASVMIQVPEKGNKLDPSYIGLYTVKRITQGGSYVLENEKGQLEPKNYAPSLLKVVSEDPIKSTDKFYEVQAIVAHKKENGKYYYNVRWKEPEEEDSWEPQENFVDPKFITEYWKRRGEVPEDLSWKKKYKYDITEKNRKRRQSNQQTTQRKRSKISSNSTLPEPLHKQTNNHHIKEKKTEEIFSKIDRSNIIKGKRNRE